MEIEVGEFVRLSRNQGINKIIGIEEKRYILDCDIADEYGDLTCILEEHQLKDEILNHGKNIIDLIEVGDVLEIYFPIKKKTIKVFADEYFKDSLILDGIMQERIVLKSILTKEQFNQNCYRIGETV